MSFDLQKMLESKRAYRQQLAARPIGEKLRILDALRERTLAIRGIAAHSAPNVIREDAALYRGARQNVEWDAGSRMHVLDWLESQDFVEQLQEMVAPTGFVVDREPPRQPKGRHDHRESVLTGSQDNFLPKALKENLKKWWLAHSRGSKLPTWDLVVAAHDAQGTAALILVEAKAHNDELSSEGKALGTRDTEEAQARSDANHEQIGKAIEQASNALRACVPGIALSRNQSYQFCNRIAFAWKLGSLGVPVVLVYLGFLNDRTINPTFLESHAGWQAAFLSHTEAHFPASGMDKEISTLGAPFWLIVRSLETHRVSPPRDERRQLK